MGADAKDRLIRELKDSVSEQRQMNKTFRAACVTGEIRSVRSSRSVRQNIRY